MDQLTFEQLINLVRGISMSGASVLVAWIIFKPIMPSVSEWIKSKTVEAKESRNKNGEQITLAVIDEHIELLATNHFHEVKDTLVRIENVLTRAIDIDTRNLSDIKESLAYIKARINGRTN